jgi:Zn-dependent protease
VFRLFGFDVKIRTGFVIFLALIAFINPNSFGLWLAAAIAGFTLLHELGHAVAARSAGAQAAISLDFMAGYTSFRPTRALGKAQRAMISLAGPAVQIVTSCAVLLAMGVDPLSLDSVRQSSDAATAIWWAGPMIGALNLIPVLPLDGGHLAQTGLEAVLRRPALREMAVASVALTV